MKLIRLTVFLVLLLVSCSVQSPEPAADHADQEVRQLLDQQAQYSLVSQELFDRLGWSLPDNGSHVKALAEAAPQGAFDPQELESLPADQIGYTARWHVLRYPFYHLDWDITGLELTPNNPTEGMPTLAIVNGGSANWYEFFVDPLNNPGLGQYLAQRIPVILVTIPGNYKPGGWTQANADRIPEYVIGAAPSQQEVKIRNAIYTFSLIAEGTRLLLEKVSSGPLLIVGHSTGGELQFMLKNSSLRSRLHDLSLGWGSGPPAPIKREFDEGRGARAPRVEDYEKRRAWQVRGRSPEGYVSGRYIGPLNPVPGASQLEVAEGWFEHVGRRRPHFKQTLQDMEHQDMLEHREKLKQEIRQTLQDNPYGIGAEEVIQDLFAPNQSPLEGYRKMVWVVAKLDATHWNPDHPDQGLEVFTAGQFRKANPGVPVRVLLLDAPITHYGHIERPRQVAGALMAAAGWLSH